MFIRYSPLQLEQFQSICEYYQICYVKNAGRLNIIDVQFQSLLALPGDMGDPTRLGKANERKLSGILKQIIDS